MKKNFILLALLFLLLGFGLWQWSKQTKDTFAKEEHTQFAVQDTTDIARIFIADRNNATVDLRKEDGIWYYYNKQKNRKFLASQSAVSNMLNTVTSLRTRAAVTKTAVENVVKDIASKGKKVEIYNSKGKNIRTYYVGMPADGGSATYMIMEGANTPYIVYYPQWIGSLDTRYTVDELTWRDRAVFRVEPSTLEFVEVKYYAPNQQDYSFRIERNGKQYEVKPVYEHVKPLTTNYNMNNAIAYVEDFTTLIGESIVSQQNLIDSIPLMPVFATISYKTSLHEKARSFNIRPIFNPTADRGDGEQGTRQSIQRYIMDTDLGDAFISQHLVANKFFWDYRWFFDTKAQDMQATETIQLDQKTLPLLNQ